MAGRGLLTIHVSFNFSFSAARRAAFGICDQDGLLRKIRRSFDRQKLCKFGSRSIDPALHRFGATSADLCRFLERQPRSLNENERLAPGGS